MFFLGRFSLMLSKVVRKLFLKLLVGVVRSLDISFSFDLMVISC